MPADSAPAAPESAYQRLRERMVAEQIRARGVRDPRVLRAMTSVARHRFVPEALRDLAYADRPLPIGLGQTISQPYIVALMTEALRPEPGDRVLEIGTGSGYQAAVLSVLVREVYTIEIVPELHATARRRLEELGYGNIRGRSGDGYRGWPEAAPFDGILVTAAPGHVPPALVEQLRVGGRLVIPVGEEYQELRRIEKTDRGVRETVLLPVRFVPMTGEAQEPESGGNPPAEDPGGEDGEKHHPEG
ncbi:MAG: protein-L-isoaspartate(D-aspartate) O-methyltransferase [Acidobacteria bacterium]|nr:protein-L-isoaspartate(D-aspartate) O-methyltransferase [Acidobacteriota bacterium]